MRVDAEISQGRTLAWPFGAALVAAALLVFLAIETAVTAAMFSAVATIVTALSFVVLSRGAPGASSGKHRVGADARGLSVDGALVVPREEILRTKVNDELDGSCSVIIERRGFLPSHVVHVESARIAQALADTLEQPASEVVVFDALPPWAHRMRWLALVLTTSPWIVFNLLRFSPVWMLAFVLGLYALIALPIILPQKIAVGDDGILMRWAGRRRFVPFARLREARATSLGLELDLDDEHDLEIRLTHRAGGASAVRTSILDRIEEALAHHRAGGPAEDEALLTRGDRSLDTWMHDMQTLGTHGTASYRNIAIPRERLWAVLENPAADPSARQGAALALRAGLDEDDRERLTTIAQKSASPRVRLAALAIAQASGAPELRYALEDGELEEGIDWPTDDRRAGGMR